MTQLFKIIEPLFTEMPMYVILFWLILFILEKNKKEYSGFFIFFFSVTLVNHFIYWCYFKISYQIYYILDSLWISTSLAILPLFYYYIRLITIDKKIDYRWCWILFPALALGLFTSTLYVMMSSQEIDVFNNEILYHVRPRSENYSTLIQLQLYRIEAVKIVFIIGAILTVFFSLFHISDFKRRVKEFYSDSKQREILKLQGAILFLLAVFVISINVSSG